MPIYSNLYSNLARQGFTKSLTHGYAQSVVAATHPQVYASTNRPGFGLNRRSSKVGGSFHFQNAFHSSSHQSASTTVREPRSERDAGALDAYFEAWNKGHIAGEPDKEWTQFQFAKRIGWKSEAPTPSLRLEPEVAREAKTPMEDGRQVYSDQAKFQAAEEAALATIDAALNKEIQVRNDKAVFEAELSIVASRAPTPPISVPSRAPSVESGFRQSPSTSATSYQSANEQQSRSYAEHLTKLSNAGRYAEVPAVFEAMLVANIQPTAEAYNALLNATISLPDEKIRISSNAVGVYTHMMKRQVSPNTAFYSTLISLLASRSLEVSSMKQTLEEKRARYGGMEEAGKFMFASNEIELDLVSEDDRLDLAITLFAASLAVPGRFYPAETYHHLIAACSEAGRVTDMDRFYRHMEAHQVVPLAASFPPMINAFNQVGALDRAVDRYNIYKNLAIAHDNNELTIADRQDPIVYASVVKAYVASDKLKGAMKFFDRVMQNEDNSVSTRDTIIFSGFVQGLLDCGMLSEALKWADTLNNSAKGFAMSKIATVAADQDNKMVAISAFANIPSSFTDVAGPAMAMLALNVRQGDIEGASMAWQVLSHADITITESLIEPTAMYAVALIGSGQAAAGLTQSEQMFARIRGTVPDNNGQLADEIEEGVDFIKQYMTKRGIVDPRNAMSEAVACQQTFAPVSFQPTPVIEDSFDPYAASTDFKGSALISEDLERGSGSIGRQKTSRLTSALARFKNIRRAGRHPRYIIYAKLIFAAAKEDNVNLVHDIVGMARTDVPLLLQYPVVRYGWVSILDAMVGACLTIGNRALASQYHQELLEMGSAPTANTFGLYITTLKESTKTFDEASEAVKIFHRAKTEGVEPSSFLYNALIGKLGKARRIDDCLFYFAEMRALGIRPTSVTYGTIVNALCRVSDAKFAEELFEEMESMPNYKARPAPYNSLMQFFLTTKRDKAKVLAYYERMQSKGIQPTNHTYKLLVDTHATLEPINMAAAEAVLDVIRSTGQTPEAVHYSSLIHAKGCVMHDVEGARTVFDSVMADSSIRPQACLYQALFESMVANHRVSDTEPVLQNMASRRVDMTPYIANTLIHGWANELNIAKAESIFSLVGREKREPSTYEAMTRAYLAVENRAGATVVAQEMLSRGYPGAVSNKILELLGGGNEHAS
ncbi:hypothetical protein BJ878DRAFT_315753 [Calycina marina]|uniref:Tetratricopeptide repeat domain-containing protein n=1 Tax=Calycina marina TaxID=1763456 RepID=A0A9P8CGP3_9HELO|nr:hypothetical protein BJ878DRAFT_315753 [Calycina marina]